jgi:hypothetical protein
MRNLANSSSYVASLLLLFQYKPNLFTKVGILHSSAHGRDPSYHYVTLLQALAASQAILTLDLVGNSLIRLALVGHL